MESDDKEINDKKNADERFLKFYRSIPEAASPLRPEPPVKPVRYGIRESIARGQAEELYESELQKPVDYSKTADQEADAVLQEEEVRKYGVDYLINKRKIPIGKVISTGKPFFLRFPKMTQTTYNVFTFVGPMGFGKSTCVRALMYYIHKLEPQCLNIIFDPMKMEFSKLSIRDESPEKKTGLMNERMYDDYTQEAVDIEIQPDSVPVFHVIPKFALNRDVWDQESKSYRKSHDKTTVKIMQKDGGYIFAEDISRMTEEQIFNCLAYREVRQDLPVHYYLRSALRICDNKFGAGKWFVQDLIKVLREGVRKFKDVDVRELNEEEMDEIEGEDRGGGASTSELQLIEQLEKYRDAGFFVVNDDERQKYVVDFRNFIKLGRFINISYMGYKKTEKVGEDLVRGQSDLILERLIEISNEYYDALRKKEQKMDVSTWEQYLLDNWKVNIWLEESEIFMPRDCPKPNIKKWPCIKRLDYMMSFGRKYGFRNFGFITQRITKVNLMVFEESSHLFIGGMHGEDRDQILSDFGVNKIHFRMTGKDGVTRDIAIRDIVTTLSKESHEWVVIDKGNKNMAAVKAYDSPVG